MLLSCLSLCLIGFGLWIVLAGKRYREEYAQNLEGFRVGSSRQVEITVVREDRDTLACASDQVIAGLHCGYRRDLREAGPVSPADPQMLQPYVTVGNELLLGAGLWTSADMKRPLPDGRFTVVCDYDVEGVMKSAAVHFGAQGHFDPAGKAVPVGALSGCALPP